MTSACNGMRFCLPVVNRRWKQQIMIVSLRRFRCTLLVVCCLLSIAPAVSQSDVGSECFRLAPFFLAANERAKLCSGANTSSPADCARRARGTPGISGSHILELCTGAVSDEPGQCLIGLSWNMAKYLPADLRVELCKSALSDVSQCFDSSYVLGGWIAKALFGLLDRLLFGSLQGSQHPTPRH